jgi:hypothetical protein
MISLKIGVPRQNSNTLRIMRLECVSWASFYQWTYPAAPYDTLPKARRMTLWRGTGLFFYLQRSRLAHFYGSICMSAAEPVCTEWDTQRWLVEAYSWGTWIPYRIAFLLLTLTPIVFVRLLYETLRPQWPPPWRLEWTIIIFAVVLIGFHTLVYSTYRYSNHPYTVFRQSLSPRAFFRDWRNRKKYPPSYGVPQKQR